MNRRSASVVAGLVAVALGVGAAWTVRRPTTRATRAAESVAVPTAEVVTASPVRNKRTHEETSDAAPDAEKKHDPVLVRFLVKSSKDDKPIAGANIVVKPDDVDPVELTTDADGRARMPS